MNDSVIAIVSAFFIIGITAGIIAVVAMSALLADRRGAPGDPPEAGRDDAGPDGHPHWPGVSDNDFSS